MSSLRDEHGIVHMIHMGATSNRLFALCDVLDAAQRDQEALEAKVDYALRERRAASHRTIVPERNWGEEDVVDEVLSCIACIGAVREALR